MAIAAALALLTSATPAAAEAFEIDRARCIVKPRQVVQLGSPVFGVMSGFVGFNMTDYFQNWQKQLVFG